MMESLRKLQLHHQPIHFSFTHTSSSFPFKLSIRPISSFKCASIIASSSEFQVSRIPIQQSTPFRLFKSTCITLTTAAALLYSNLHHKSPSIAAPVKPCKSMEITLDEHLATHTSDVDALRSLIEVKIKSRKLIEAMELIDRLLILKPIEPESESGWLVLKANFITFIEYLDSAKNRSEKILSKDPFRVEAYYDLLIAYSILDLDLKEIEKRIEKAMVRCKTENNHNDFREFKLLVTHIRVIEGNHDVALKLYQELVKEEPGDFRPYLCKGIIYTLRKKKDKAKEELDKFRKLQKNHPYNEYYMDILLALKFLAEKIQLEIAESNSLMGT